MNRPSLTAALDYIPRWIAHQMCLAEQPGCALAVVHQGRIVLDSAFGHADLARGQSLTPRHRFRVASHSKSFTAAGILRLREAGQLGLDDRIGKFVKDLHPQVASATLAQLLSHSAGLVRDGADAGQWADRRAFLNQAELRADLSDGPVIDANTRFKYSNHGYGLLGLAIEAVSGESYAEWVAREVIAAAGLEETLPDAPVPARTPFARGHSAKWPLGRRVGIPGDNPTNALAPATGFVSTAADLARFYAQLSPTSKKSVLSVASRREMTRRQWRERHSSLERWYGLGTISGTILGGSGGSGDWEWFGHSGGFQGTITRTVAVPSQQLALSVLTNSADGLSHVWLDGCLHILRAFDKHGAASRRTATWAGRWWSLWGAFDLLAMGGDKVLVANPALPNPLLDATELQIGPRGRSGLDQGRIALAGGFANHGEPVRLVRDARGKPAQLWLGGSRYLPEAKVAKELVRKYQRP